MILLTTSRKPSNRTRRFARELSYTLPYALYMPRGKSSIADLIERAEEKGFHRIIIIGETKGNPSILRVLVREDRWHWFAQAYITSVSLYVDLGLRPVRILADGLTLKTDRFSDFIRGVFGVYEESDILTLEERDGNIRFLYEGREVGPRFKITGVDPVPSALRL